jgi:hypothetical protein
VSREVEDGDEVAREGERTAEVAGEVEGGDGVAVETPVETPVVLGSVNTLENLAISVMSPPHLGKLVGAPPPIHHPTTPLRNK